MSDLISASLSEILGTASKFTMESGNLESMLTAITAQIATMSTWKGDAQVNFNGIMDEWNTAQQNMRNTLDDITRRLNKYEQDMSLLDSTTKFG